MLHMSSLSKQNNFTVIQRVDFGGSGWRSEKGMGERGRANWNWQSFSQIHEGNGEQNGEGSNGVKGAKNFSPE